MRLVPASILFALLPAAFAAAEPIEVSDPERQMLAIALSDAADALTEAIGTCRSGGDELPDCLCAHRGVIAAVRHALGAVLAAEPGWKDQSLFVADMGDGRSLTIFLDTAARMAAEPECP